MLNVCEATGSMSHVQVKNLSKQEGLRMQYNDATGTVRRKIRGTFSHMQHTEVHSPWPWEAEVTGLMMQVIMATTHKLWLSQRCLAKLLHKITGLRCLARVKKQLLLS